MGTLKENLTEIKRQKDTYLLPENLKQGVTCLGITGTLTPGSETSGGVKLFATVDEMNADPNPQEGDLAIVYRSEVKNATVDSKFQVATFPDTVVLDTAMTGNVEVRYRAVDSSVMFDCMGQLDSSNFMMSCYTETGNIRIEYTSSDGITYTRTDTTGNPVDFGTEIYYEMAEMWNDAIGKFIQVSGSIFEGLYENVSYVSDIQIEALKGTSNQDTQDYELLKVSLPSLASKVMDLWSSGGKLLFTYNPVTRLGKIVKSGMDLALINYQNNTYAGIADSRNDRTYDTADINFDTMTISNIVTNTGYTGLTNVGPIGHSNYDGYLVFDYDATDLLFCIYVYDKNNARFRTVLYTTDTTGSLTTTSIVSGKKHDVMKNHYVTASTQLSAIADYVYEKEFYGQNGVEVGTLTQGVSNSFDDTNAEIYGKIQNYYDTLEPRVLTDSDKTIDKSIRYIPIKSDGTPLLDTSNVTNISSMFRGCTNLTTIPLLNTSNVTNMSYMCTECANLTTIALLDTSNVTTMYAIFAGCTNLTTIPSLNTSNVVDMYQMFCVCKNLTTIPSLNTSNVTNMYWMFYGCTNLTTIPLLSTSKVTNMQNMFKNCTSLSDESLNNILTMCKNATSYTSTKTLQYIGLTSAQAAKCQSLSNYSAFTTAGWTTGY